MRGVRVAVILEFVVEITVGIMMIEGIHTIIMILHIMILHVVERRMLIIMIAKIAMAAEVTMLTGQAGIIHIVIDITMVTHQVAQLKDIHTREGTGHLLLVRRDITVIGTSHGGKIKRENYLIVMREGSLVLYERRREDVITVQAVLALQEDITVIVKIVRSQKTSLMKHLIV